MKHNLILSPSIYFYENQTILIDNMLKNKHEYKKTEEGQFFNFNINKQEYTFIISSYSQAIIYFIKGRHLDHKFKPEDIVFKSHFNLIQGAKKNEIELNETIVEYDKLFSPDYNNVSNRYDMRNYSGFDKVGFRNFCTLMNNNDSDDMLGDLLFQVYINNYDVVKNTVSFIIKDLYETLNNEKFKDTLVFEDITEAGGFVRSGSFLIESRDSSLDVIEFKCDEIIFYYIDKDEYFSNFTDDDYEDPETVFFDNDDLFTMGDKVKNQLMKFEKGILSEDEMIMEPCNLFYMLSSIDSTNRFLFKEYAIVDNKKIIELSEIEDVNHAMLCSSSYKWLNGKLYNPNKTIDVDTSSLLSFLNKPSFKHATLFVNPLLISYKKDIGCEYLEAVDNAIKYAYKIIDKEYKTEDQESMKKMSLENMKEVVKYRKKIVL
jgi:hypothetical protein